MRKKDILGIVGGMGSHAAVSLFQSIVNKCPAKTDRDFIEILVHNNSNIPDRTEAILRNGDSPLPEIMRSVQLLHSQGASSIVMACFTAHYYCEQIKKNFPEANLINLIEVVSNHIKENLPHVNKVGVIASTGAVQSNIWKENLAEAGVQAVYLSDEEQEAYFTEAIYGERGIKRGCLREPKEMLLKAGNRLIEQGAQAILSSCSELPLVLSKKDFDVDFIDSFDILTNHIIDSYYEMSLEVR
jgi:aspartate racemase